MTSALAEQQDQRIARPLKVLVPLIAACRELIQTMYPVIDVLERELSGGVGHMALNTASGQDALHEAGTEGRDVLAQRAAPAA